MCGVTSFWLRWHHCERGRYPKWHISHCVWTSEGTSYLFYICFTFVLLVSFCLTPPVWLITFHQSHNLFLQPKTPGTSTSFVQSQDQYLTLLFISSSFVFISHLTNFLSYSVFMFVACFFCLTLSLRKNLLGSKRQANNHYFAFILQVL